MAGRKSLSSKIARSTPDKIIVKDLDLCEEILGRFSLGDAAFLILMSRAPTAPESAVFDAMAITLIEHGLSPSAIACRMTLLGAPESMQGAVAAGLLGLGDVFVGSMETAARMLQEGLPPEGGGEDLEAAAEKIVAVLAAAGRPVPGIGHPIHKPVDPRTPKLFQIAAANGLHGRYVEFMQLIATAGGRRSGKPLPVNATGAIAALASEIGMPWNVVRGIGLMSRSIGLVGHIQEERQNPIAREVALRVVEEAEH